MKRVIARLLTVAVLLMTLTAICSITANAESLYIRKIVSVVYDDSGSMHGEDKWAYANYAMQTFCGMLNSEDQLYVTYMQAAKTVPDYEPEKIDLSPTGIQNSIDTVKNHSDHSSTPYKAVEIAFDKLKKVEDSNPNTQYWLIILTDGTFDRDEYIHNPDKSDELTDYFESYVSETMFNGTNPQVTYFAIGSDALKVPAQEDKGLYTYSCSQASEIVETMSDIADRVSGRTRLDKSDMKLLDEKTVQISSAIPLLNIAVLSQETDAKIINANYSNETDIPVSRYAALDFREYNSHIHDELIGNAYLLGDSKSVIGSGTYEIKFDKAVSLDDLVFLFEPALEMRVNISVNGQKIDNSELKNTSAGDKISVSCGIYEMNTENEINSDLLPENTSYDIYIYEDGNISEHISGKDMQLKDYELKNIETKLVASAKIENFNPIEYTKKFTPGKYIPKVYTISAEWDNGVRSIKYDDVVGNKDVKLKFTVSLNGEVMTNPEEIKLLSPKIEVSPDGNDGDINIESDGTITYTPNKIPSVSVNADNMNVEVTCTISDGTSAKESYNVLMADYQVFGKDAEHSVRKNELFGNKTGVSFYITKDGVKLDKSQVESGISTLINNEYKHLKLDVKVDDDGTINCIPKDENEREYNFLTWWGNWWYYFGLESADMTITLSHDYGTANAEIDVIGADMGYIVGWVAAPLATEIILLALVTAYITRYVTKPRFSKKAALYVGTITFSDTGLGTHLLTLKKHKLRQYNRFKNLWNPFKPLTVSVGGISVSAEKNNRIKCREKFPWFMESELKSEQIDGDIDHPEKICDKIKSLAENYIEVREIEPSNIRGEGDRVIKMNSLVYYCVKAQAEYGEGEFAKEARRINSAKIFCYTSDKN